MRRGKREAKGKPDGGVRANTIEPDLMTPWAGTARRASALLSMITGSSVKHRSATKEKGYRQGGHRAQRQSQGKVPLSVVRARRKFLRIFPGGFRDETYIAWERGSSGTPDKRWNEELGDPRFCQLVDRAILDK